MLTDKGMTFYSKTIAVVVMVMCLHINCAISELNVTEHLAQENLLRQKRYLTFSGGAFRCVMGSLSRVVYRAIKVQWQQGFVYYTFSSGWALPSTPFYFWNQFPFQNVVRSFAENQSRSLEVHHHKLIEGKTPTKDDTRKQIYDFLAYTLNSNEAKGKDCIYRAICTTVRFPLSHNGIFGEIWDAVFTPNRNEVSSDYMDALSAGQAGVECEEVFSKCPLGHGVLEKYSYFLYS